MRNRGTKRALLFLAGMLALALLALVSATETGSSEAQQGAMQNCPQAGKWAVAVWDGDDGTDAEQAFATCGEGVVAVAYSIDPDTQVWSRWFAGRPEISNLTALNDVQGVMALGGTGAPVTPTPSPTPTPTVVEGVSVDDDPSWGPEDAPVTIIEFSEFLCPYCLRFAMETLPQIKQAYEGKVRYVYRDFIVHGEPAMKISEAAECAHDQDKFWEYHDKLWENFQALGQQAGTGMDALVSTLKGYAADVGLGTATFNDCLDTGKHTAEVQKDSQDAQSYGARGTPAFFINGQLVSGAQPYSVFQQVIDAALEEAEAGSPAQGDTMRNCPQAGKWAIAVWDGNDGTDAAQALATCGEGGVAVAYSIGLDTQVWSRWFAGRPEISNLTALDNMQGVMALGAGGAPATPTPSPTPTATPVEAMLPQGWERHTTASIQIDVPETWEAWDVTEEGIEALVEELRSWNPAFAALFEEEATPELFEFFAFDTESVEFVNSLNIIRDERPFPTTVAATIAQLQIFYPLVGLTVLATDSDLTIGGMKAGSIQTQATFGPYTVRQVQYVVQAEPDVLFGLSFAASADDFDALEPVFDKIAKSFRVLD